MGALNEAERLARGEFPPPEPPRQVRMEHILSALVFLAVAVGGGWLAGGTSGAVIGAVLGVIALVVLAVWLFRKRRPADAAVDSLTPE